METTPGTATLSNADSTTPPAAETQQEEIQNGNIKKFIPIFIVLCLGVFQVALDEVVLGITAPTITDEFGSLNDIGWYGSAYLFTSSSFQLLFGRLYSICPVKLVYLAALAIFEIGSIICATAPSSEVFIFGRAVAGLGAGGILSGSLTIISRSLPRSKVAPFNGIVGAVNAIAFFTGPLIGGGIIAHNTWRWVFYMNPILSAPTFALVIFMLHLDPPKKTTWKQKLSMIDLPAFVILAGSIVSLLLALQWGGTTYSWRNIRIIVLFILFGLLLLLFLTLQVYKKDNGLVPMRIFTDRSMAFGMFFSFCTSGAGFALEYYLPIWLQVIKLQSVLRSGINLLPIIASAIVFTLASGFLVSAIGYYVPFMFLASIFLSVGLGLLSTLSSTSPLRFVLGYQVPAGVGLGLALQQTILAVQTILPMDYIPIGISLIVLSQTLGGVISLAVSGTILSSSLSSSVARSIPGVDESVVQHAGATNLDELIPSEFLDTFLALYNRAIVETWYFSLALACVSILGAAGMEWKRVAPPSQLPPNDICLAVGGGEKPGQPENTGQPGNTGQPENTGQPDSTGQPDNTG